MKPILTGLVAATLLFLALLRVVNSPFGRVLLSIRENEFRSEAIGYRLVTYRTVANCLAALGDRVAGICAAQAGRCSVDVAELTRASSLTFPESMTRLVRESAAALGIPAIDIHSAAGHDARFLHAVCPTGMIFVPCKDGISHNARESATPEDLAAGTRVLVDVLMKLAND